MNRVWGGWGLTCDGTTKPCLATILCLPTKNPICAKPCLHLQSVNSQSILYILLFCMHSCMQKLVCNIERTVTRESYNGSVAVLHNYIKYLECLYYWTKSLTSPYSDLRSLSGAYKLSTLVLDDNEVNSHVVFPSIPSLKVLWVNKNKINNLTIFVGTVASTFPSLKHLSMMNNPAAPSYFNGGSRQEHEDYR